MAINCYCHPNRFECPVLYGDIPGFDDTKPNYPVPAPIYKIEFVFFGGFDACVWVIYNLSAKLATVHS